MDGILISIMLFFATGAAVAVSLAVMMFFFLLTREMIKDNLHD